MILTPEEIHIEGDFWDSYINNDILYLWTVEGFIEHYSWSKMVNFCRENHTNWISVNMLRSFKLEYKYSGHDMLPLDFGFHKDKMYIISDEGFLEIPKDLDTRYMFESARMISDLPFLRLNIKKNGRMALAAGEEGLFEYSEVGRDNYLYTRSRNSEPELTKIIHNHSLIPSWSFSSIYSTSNKEDSILAVYYWDYGRRIQFGGKFTEEEIFGDIKEKTLSWAYNGKLYKAVSGGIKQVNFKQNQVMMNDPRFFSEPKFIPFQQWKGSIISAGAFSIGSIIECEYALVVMRNETTYYNIRGPVVRWRVFTQDESYMNHLHVILENKISIYLF